MIRSARHAYGKIRAFLEKAGRGVDSVDLLIAAHACSLQAVLVTHNLKEFRRVLGLKLEDWTIADGEERLSGGGRLFVNLNVKVNVRWWKVRFADVILSLSLS